MKRSNRLVLLVVVFLAIVDFVVILLLVRSPGTDTSKTPVATTGPVVVATVDIPLSTRVRADQVATTTVPLAAIPAGAFIDTTQVIGQVVRQPVSQGAQLTAATFGGSGQGSVTEIATPVGMRSMAVQVDQVSGVGTVIKTGDFVDMVVGIAADKFPVFSVNPADDSIQVLAGLNNTSVKLLLQGLQVMGTLLPPPAPPTTGTASAPPSTGSGPTTLNGQQQIVIMAVTAQQSEVVKFVQLDGNVTLALRSPDDFIDPITGQPLPQVPVLTSGIILKTLVDDYGVLPPEVVQTVTPEAP